MGNTAAFIPKPFDQEEEEVSASTEAILTFPRVRNPTRIDPIKRAHEIFAERGLEVPKGGFIVDGKFHRLPGDMSYSIFLSDAPTLLINDFHNGSGGHEPEKIPLYDDKKLTEEQKAKFKERVKADKAKHEKVDAKNHVKVAAEAERIWKEATPAREDHPYLVKKGVKFHGLREHQGKLVVPVRRNDKLVGLQFIDEEGGKRFLPGTHKQGASCIIGERSGNLGIGEGWATGAAVYEATGESFIVAFDVGNIEHVAKEEDLEGYPGGDITVYADDDWKRTKPGTDELENIGVIKARSVAHAIGAKLAVPVFGEGRGEKDTDFNDLFRREGPEAIKRCRARADYVKEAPKPQDEKKPPEGAGGPDEQPKPPSNKFTLIRYENILPVLEEEWIIDDLLPSSGLGVIYGPPGCGKSFFALDLMLHAASGTPYGGRTTKKARVVYIASEGQTGFLKRVTAAGEALKLNPADDVQFALIPVAPNLGMDSTDLALLIEAIKAGNREGDAPVGAIVIDTLSRSLGGADENGPGMAKFIENAGELSRHFGGAITLAVHHTGKDASRGMRGWSGLHGATDVEFEVVQRNGVRNVCITKMKDGASDIGWGFSLTQVEIGRATGGRVVTTCVIEPLSNPAPVDRNQDSGAAGKPRKDAPRSLRTFDEAFNEAMIVHKKKISLTGAGAILTQVEAVDLKVVREEFSKRWAVIPDEEDGDAKAQKRKLDKAISEAFRGITNKLPRQYRTELQGDVQYIWRLEWKA